MAVGKAPIGLSGLGAEILAFTQKNGAGVVDKQVTLSTERVVIPARQNAINAGKDAQSSPAGLATANPDEGNCPVNPRLVLSFVPATKLAR